MGDILYLEPDEEITSVIDKLRQAPGSRVSLVVPRGATLLQSVINLKLLAKEAANLKKDIALVTSDKIGRNLAAQVGMVVYESLKNPRPIYEPAGPQQIPAEEVLEVDMGNEAKPDGVSVHHFQDQGKNIPGTLPPVGPVPKEKPQLKQMSPSFQGKPTNINLHHPNRIKKIGKVFLGLLIILVLAALAIGYLVFPKVQVNIKVLAENFSKTAEVRVSGSETALDPSVYAGKMIDVTKEKEDKFQATGKKNLGGKAAGSITIYNNLDSSNHSFSAGTKLSSSSKTFLLKSAATVPGATVQNLKIVPGVVTVEIEAENPGEDYNIDAGRFTIIGLSAAQQEAIYGQSTKDMLGGFSKEVQVISQDDYDQAKTKLVADLNGQIDQEIKKDAADLQILDKSTVVETAQPKVSANVGDQASEFTMQISVRGRVIAFAQDGFRTFVITTFEKELPSEKMLTLGPDDKISPSVKETQYDKKLLVLNVDLTGKSSIRLDQDKIKKDLLGKNKGEFTSLLNKVDGISSWTIDFTPPWWIKRIPNYPKNIAINLEYVLKDTQPVLDGSKELN